MRLTPAMTTASPERLSVMFSLAGGFESKVKRPRVTWNVE